MPVRVRRRPRREAVRQRGEAGGGRDEGASSCRAADSLTINSVFINQAPWYIKQRVKTVTELARHSSVHLSHKITPLPPIENFSTVIGLLPDCIRYSSTMVDLTSHRSICPLS